MEGLRFGWLPGVRSDTYHYISDFSHKDFVKSLCGKYSSEPFYLKNREFLEKFEILDSSKICHICELKINQRKQNYSKSQFLVETNSAISSDGFVLKKFICSEPSCTESGAAFVSVNSPKEEHYCIKHNLRVQQVIKEQKKLEVIP